MVIWFDPTRMRLIAPDVHQRTPLNQTEIVRTTCTLIQSETASESQPHRITQTLSINRNPPRSRVSQFDHASIIRVGQHPVDRFAGGATQRSKSAEGANSNKAVTQRNSSQHSFIWLHSDHRELAIRGNFLLRLRKILARPAQRKGCQIADGACGWPVLAEQEFPERSSRSSSPTMAVGQLGFLGEAFFSG